MGTTRFHLDAPPHDDAGGLFSDEEYAAVRAFAAANPALRPTPLHRLDGLAAELGLLELYVKDESARDGLNAFKIAGVRYAIARLLGESSHPPAGLVAATAGNHGRALARVGRELGVPVRIHVPRHTIQARIEALVEEGAQVVVSAGDYEDAVREAAADGTRGFTIVSDTSWPGYERIPRWIMAGYTRVVDEAIEACAGGPPDAVFVQGGVGGLVCAAASYFAHRFRRHRPAVVACEPLGAPCLLESAKAGRLVTLPRVDETIMACLQCAEPSPVAWRGIAGLVDAYVAVSDVDARRAIRRLAHAVGQDPRIAAGASGACGLAGAIAVLEDPSLSAVRRVIGLDRPARVLVFNTEGPTDPELYRAIVASEA